MDPDPYPDSMVSPDPYPDSQSESRRPKMTHKDRKKFNKFNFFKYLYSLLRAEGFSCSLDVLYEGVRISKLQFLSKKYTKQFSVVFFFLQFLFT